MSYCRFMEGDVYAYECDGGVQFYISDNRRELDRLCSTFNEAYQYAKELRDSFGVDVPNHAIEALKADAIEEATRICGSNSAVSELEAENAKLREQIETLVMYVEADGTRYWVDDDGNQHFDQSAVKDDAAELRELVRDMKAIIWAYDEYTSDDDCPPALQLVENRLRELGFEVDE